MSTNSRQPQLHRKPPAAPWKDDGSGKNNDDDDDNLGTDSKVNNDSELSKAPIDTISGLSKAKIPINFVKYFIGYSVPDLVPSFGFILKSIFGITISLYILNQKHLLPKPISRVVSKCLFWPTMPVTVGRRIGSWETVVDDTVIMGGAPFGFAKIPEKLYQQYEVRGVINMCEEYRGPVNKYKQLGMKYLHLPTVDHFEPSIADLEEAIRFIQSCARQGNKVYVHCRAGHGRSAAVVMAWWLSKNPYARLKDLNEKLCSIRDVRKTLWKQPNIIRLQSRLQHQDTDAKSDTNDASDLT